jgi:hypothetical protein
MRILMIAVALLFVSCYTRIDNANIHDCGKKEIGPGVYLKKIVVSGDRIYMLVDAEGKLISGNTATSYTITDGNNNTHTESNSLINQ